MFVTAASSNHFRSAKQFIRSLNGAPVIFYDIGLSETEVEEIKHMTVEYRLFDWSTVPSWGALTAPNAGSYLWKPIIIHTLFKENYEMIIWCDAGNKISDRLALENYVRHIRLYTPLASGTVQRWCHTTCLDGMNVTEEERKYPIRNAAIIGFIASDPAVKQLVEDWKMYSLKEELISGSRDNHRHDQSILSCLFYRYKRACTSVYVGLSIHNDCD